MIGQSIENYRIEELLGQGGMGSVYRATDTSLDRAVALKIMNPAVATNADFLRRFKSEARVLGRLQHPNIVNVYTFRHVDSHLIIVMEYVGGGTLSDLIDQHGAIAVPKSLDLLNQSLNALEFAHASNIIHRDIKPPNILLTESHVVKVSDFGLAKIQEDSNATMLTRVGMTGGTLHYMPPEQTEALSKVDHRGDIYSLGMTFYQMLAGRVPFDRNSSAFSILRAIDQQKIPKPDSFNSTIPKELVEIVMKSIKKYPDDRFQSAAEMREAIEHFEQGTAFTPEPEEPSGYAKTQVLSKPLSFGNSGEAKTPQKLFQKSKSKGDEKFAVGSRSSSKVKKKKPSRVSKAGQSGVRPSEAPGRKKWIPIAGILLLIVAGIFAIPQFLPSSSDRGNTDTNTTNSEPAQQTTPAAGSQETGRDLEQIAAETGEEESPDTGEADNTAQNTSPEAQIDQPATPAPVAQTRTVTVRSNPSGATVTMNGRQVGTTPLTLDNVEATRHTFQLSLRDHETVRQTLDVSRQTTLSASLSPLTGQVRVIVRPFGDIIIDGAQKATQTSLVYQDELPAGTHKIQARHPVLGMWDKQVSVRPGQEQEVLFNFAEEFSLTVASLPPNAVILIDGEPLMSDSGPVTTPRLISLHPGNHSINVQLQGFRVTNGPIDIVLEEDIDDPLIFSLETQ